MYILVEGTEFVGKSTLIRNFRKHYSKDGVSVTAIREPGQTDVGIAIRAMIMKNKNISPKARMFLFLADRAETSHRYKSIAVEKDNSILISDRGYISGIAHALKEMPEEAIRYEVELMNDIAMDYHLPDVVFLLMGKKETLLSRMKSRESENYMDEVGVEKMLEMQEMMHFILSTSDSIPYYLIDATLSEEEMLLEVHKVMEYMDKEGGGVPSGEISINS